MIIVAIIVPGVVMLVIGACLGVMISERGKHLCEVCFDSEAEAKLCRSCANRAAGLSTRPAQ